MKAFWLQDPDDPESPPRPELPFYLIFALAVGVMVLTILAGR